MPSGADAQGGVVLLEAAREHGDAEQERAVKASVFEKWASYPKPAWYMNWFPLSLVRYTVRGCTGLSLVDLEYAMLISYVTLAHVIIKDVYGIIVTATNDALQDPAFFQLAGCTAPKDDALYWLHGTNWYLLVVMAFPFAALGTILFRVTKTIVWEYLYWRLLERGFLLEYTSRTTTQILLSRNGAAIWLTLFAGTITMLWVQKVYCDTKVGIHYTPPGGGRLRSLQAASGASTCVGGGFLIQDPLGNTSLDLDFGAVVLILTFTKGLVSQMLGLLAPKGKISLAEMVNETGQTVTSAADWIQKYTIVKEADLERLMKVTYLKLEKIHMEQGEDAARRHGEEHGLLIDLNDLSTFPSEEELRDLWAKRFESDLPFKMRFRYNVFGYHLIPLLAGKYIKTSIEGQFVKWLTNANKFTFVSSSACLVAYAAYIYYTVFWQKNCNGGGHTPPYTYGG